MPEQGPLNETTIRNLNTSEITEEIHFTGLTYTATGATCPEAGTKSNGSYRTGNFILTAEKDNANREMVAIQVNPKNLVPSAGCAPSGCPRAATETPEYARGSFVPNGARASSAS
jgi:hypothetical protein